MKDVDVVRNLIEGKKLNCIGRCSDLVWLQFGDITSRWSDREKSNINVSEY